MALITGTSKKKPMTLLSTDLAGLVKFDSKQTLPVSDISSEKYNEGMNLYLQHQLKIFEIDKEYNTEIEKFEMQLQEMELSAKLNASLAAESQANIAVEAQPGLGTGAAAVAGEGRQKALNAANHEIESGMAEAYQTGMQSIGEEYQAKLESVLGEYDPITNTFAGLAAYETMSNEATVAMAKVIATMIDPDVNTYGTDYINILKNAGYIAEITADGEVTFTDLGKQAFDVLLNSIDTNEAQAALGDKTLIYALAEQMAKAQYSDEEYWESLSDLKRQESITEYASWLHNNENSLRLTAWDLYSVTNNGYILDTEYSTEVQNMDGIDGNSGIPVIALALDDVSDCNQEEFEEIKTKLLYGEISDGSYFTFQSGQAYEDDKFYYVKNGTVYKTEYTVDDPPPIIRADQATVYSFGRYQDTGKGKFKQDEWVEAIIDAANAGRIPDGTYINFNYGASDDGHKDGWYKFENGVFTSVSGNTLVDVTYNGTPTKAKLSSIASYDDNKTIHHFGFAQSRRTKGLDW